MYYDIVEAIAHRGLISAGYCGVVAPKMRGVAYGLRISIRRTVPDQMRGWADRQMRIVRLGSSRDEIEQEAVLAHELMHQLGTDGGLTDPHDEEAIDVGAMHLRMPIWGLRRLVKSDGLTPSLAGHYPMARPSEVLLWAAHVTEHIAMLHWRGRRRVSACRYIETAHDLPTESLLVSTVEREGRPIRDPYSRGIIAWPFVEEGKRGVLVVADLRSLERAW